MKDTAKTRDILDELTALGNKEKADFLKGFFKTGKGEYGEGDRFLGVRVPQLRKLAQKHKKADKMTVLRLLQSEWHEARLLALLIWVLQFERGNADVRSRIFDLFMENIEYVDSWDMTDLSAPKIVGPYLIDGDRGQLYRMLEEEDLWKRRIAMISTLHFIRQGDFEDTLTMAEKLITDKRDLIQKASGWMLREVGKRDEAALDKFLNRHLHTMPRVMLRYAIEKFPEKKRLAYLRGEAAD